ncbi:MAG: hypothetical protein WDN04_20425 [Rhodospirillales bacterium]
MRHQTAEVVAGLGMLLWAVPCCAADHLGADQVRSVVAGALKGKADLSRQGHARR